MSRRRLPAFLLLFALLGGGFVLPMADALLYHSGASTESAARQDSTLSTATGPAHLLGCVLWLTALTGSGIQSNAPALRTASDASSTAAQVALDLFGTQADFSLGLSRAPPLA